MKKIDFKSYSKNTLKCRLLQRFFVSHLYCHIGCFECVLVQWTGKNANGSTYLFRCQDSTKIAEWLSVDAFSATLCYQTRDHSARAIVSRVGITLTRGTHVHPRSQIFLSRRSVECRYSRMKRSSSQLQDRNN